MKASVREWVLVVLFGRHLNFIHEDVSLEGFVVILGQHDMADPSPQSLAANYEADFIEPVCERFKRWAGMPLLRIESRLIWAWEVGEERASRGRRAARPDTIFLAQDDLGQGKRQGQGFQQSQELIDIKMYALHTSLVCH